MPVTVRFATQGDRTLLLDSDDLFDETPRAEWVDAFLGDPRHHMALALDQDACVGFLSAVDYVHPDKPPQLWINELGVVETRRREGIATSLIEAAMEKARGLFCTEMWVLADPTEEAIGFYESLNATREGSHVAMFTFQIAPPGG